MSTVDHLDAIRRDGDVFYATALVADADLGVPRCPEWTIADLVWHLSRVHYFWASVVAERIVDDGPFARLRGLARPAEYGDVIAFGREQLDRLIAVLRDTDDATPVWTWSTQRDVGFIRRHQVQETAVHRWDLQNAARHQSPDPLDREVAHDAIDEFLTFSLPRRRPGSLPGTVHLHATDGEGEWFIDTEGNVERAHAKGDVAVRGSASDLLLALYARIDLDGLEVFGDPAIAQYLVDSIDLG